jgi:hypothetical protein
MVGAPSRRPSQAWRADLTRDLGGNFSTQQAALVDIATRTKLLLESVDAWLLSRPSPVNARKRALLPIVRERTQLADSLARTLTQLGLRRVAQGAFDVRVEFLLGRGQPWSSMRRSPSDGCQSLS